MRDVAFMVSGLILLFGVWLVLSAVRKRRRSKNTHTDSTHTGRSFRGVLGIILVVVSFTFLWLSRSLPARIDPTDLIWQLVGVFVVSMGLGFFFQQHYSGKIDDLNVTPIKISNNEQLTEEHRCKIESELSKLRRRENISMAFLLMTFWVGIPYTGLVLLPHWGIPLEWSLTATILTGIGIAVAFIADE